MNQLLQIIEEQKKEFEQKFTGYEFTFNNPVTLKESIQDWQNSSLKAILQAQVEMLEKMKLHSQFGEDAEMEAYNDALQTQINLLQETINSL